MPRLPQHVVLIVGGANLFADGLSMAVGNYLAMATFLAFVTAGTVPLFPYMIGGDPAVRFQLSTAFTLAALFLIGASRSLIGRVTWWLGGVEMLALGAVVAAVAFASGSIVAAIADAVATP